MREPVTPPGVSRLRSLIPSSAAFIVLALGCHRAPVERPPVQLADADWKVDGCRVTYKGILPPLGQPVDSFIALFGPPSDSHVSTERNNRKWTAYFWDDLGLFGAPSTSGEPDRIIILQVNFANMYLNKYLNEGPREPRSIAKIAFDSVGRLDSSTAVRIIEGRFSHNEPVFGSKTYWETLHLGDSSYLGLVPQKDDSDRYFGMAFSYSGMNSPANPPSYRQAVARLDGACNLLPEFRDLRRDSLEILRLEQAAGRLQKLDAEEVANSLIKALAPDPEPVKRLRIWLDSLKKIHSNHPDSAATTK